jgi:hypothetical protein
MNILALADLELKAVEVMAVVAHKQTQMMNQLKLNHKNHQIKEN